METTSPLSSSQVVVRICLFLVAAIALFGGTLQMIMGEPETTPRLDNIHRFMAGVYLGSGLIAGWAAINIRKQGTLIYLMAFIVFLAGTGRLISTSLVGLPEPHGLWIGYAAVELVVPLIIVIAQRITDKTKS